MNNEELQNRITELENRIASLSNNSLSTKTRKNLERIDGHTHNGLDFPTVSTFGLDSFRILMVADATSTPTIYATQGTLIFQQDDIKMVLWVKTSDSWKSLLMDT